MKIIGTASWLFLLAIASGCGDGNTPWPTLTNGPQGDADAASDATDTSPMPTDPTSTLPPQVNGYICYCAGRVPLNCLSGGCGIAGSGTHADTSDCVIEPHQLHICLPPVLNTTGAEVVAGAHVPTLEEVQQDCQGRVQALVREGLRFVFNSCDPSISPGLGPCDISYGCTAVRVDGTIQTFQDARCSNSCPYTRLVHDDSFAQANVQQATYVEASDEVMCPGQTNQTTERVCGWL